MIGAKTASDVFLEEVVVMVRTAAQVAHKRLIEGNHIEFLLQFGTRVLVRRSSGRELFLLN